MKVKELIEMFNQDDMDKEVYLSKDGEGNGFRLLSDSSDQICVKREGGQVDIFNEDEPEEFEGEEIKKVVVLW